METDNGVYWRAIIWPSVLSGWSRDWEKPRETGLTIVADRGKWGRIAWLIFSIWHYIDFFKIAIGAYRLQRGRFCSAW